jgi:hypothetical protein
MVRKHTLTGTLTALAIGAAVAAPAGAQPTDLRSPDAKDAARPAASQDLRSPDAKDVPQPVDAAGLRAEAQERYYSSYGQPAPAAPAAPVASDGFEWGTAGIGLGTGAGLVLLTLGGMAMTRRRNQSTHPA